MVLTTRGLVHAGAAARVVHRPRPHFAWTLAGAFVPVSAPDAEVCDADTAFARTLLAATGNVVAVRFDGGCGLLMPVHPSRRHDIVGEG